VSSETNALIVSSVIVTVGSGFVASVTEGKAPTFNAVLGGGFMGAFLFAVALINDEVARLFAILIMLGVILRNGDALFSWIGKSSAQKVPSSLTSTSTIKNA
jgi:hypothetical protein